MGLPAYTASYLNVTIQNHRWMVVKNLCSLRAGSKISSRLGLPTALCSPPSFLAYPHLRRSDRTHWWPTARIILLCYGLEIKQERVSLTQVKQPGNPVAQRTKVFVCHQGEFNESELDGLDIFEGLNLENIRLPGRDNRFANRLAEARAFFKPLPDDVNQIGFVSWRLSEKRGDGLSWKDIYRAVSRQNSSQVSGPYQQTGQPGITILTVLSIITGLLP